MLQLEDELAYVIHTIPYRNSSLICDVLTEYHGRVKLLVFSARGPKSKFRGVFRTFSLLKISAKGKTELKKVTQADSVNSLIHLQSTPLFCGYYIHELIQHCLAVEDAANEVFVAYQQALQQLQQPDALAWEAGLRIFEKSLLEHCGFGIDFASECEAGGAIEANLHYQFLINQGFKQVVSTHPAAIPGQVLINLAQSTVGDHNALPYLKHIFRMAIAECLQGKQLQSKLLLKSLL